MRRHFSEAYAIHKERLVRHPQLYDESFRSRVLAAADLDPRLLEEAQAVAS